MAHIWCTWDHSILLRTSSTIVDIRESEDNWIKNDIWLKNDSIWRNTMFNTLNFWVKSDYEYYQEIIFNTIACCTATKCILIEISRLLSNLPTFSRLWKKNNKNLFCTVHDHSCLYSVILPRWFCWCFWLTARFCIASLARHVNNTRLN